MTTNRPRCRFCFGQLKEPWCTYCAQTHMSAARIIGAAHEIFRARGAFFDDVILTKLRAEDVAQREVPVVL